MRCGVVKLSQLIKGTWKPRCCLACEYFATLSRGLQYCYHRPRTAAGLPVLLRDIANYDIPEDCPLLKEEDDG